MELDHSESTEEAHNSMEGGNAKIESQEDPESPKHPDEDSKYDSESKESTSSQAFKMPSLIIGPRRGKPIAVRSICTEKPSDNSETPLEDPDAEVSTPEESTKETPHEPKYPPLLYKEPTWGGIPENKYKIEVLKSGVILEVFDLSKKSYHVIGRLPICDIPLAHPTISRYHAILQYRTEGDDKNGPGLYLYDLESTHGSFWNGCRIRPKTYVKLQGGHMLKFGCSQRKFIIQTPSDEVEEESEYTVTELKEMRRLELLEREKEELERREKEEELERLRKEKEESDGISWGMGEDADEETDLTENPYALTNNEQLFLDDPKKTLRGWFEREGHDLQYQTEEKGVGQFLCWVEIPIENSTGRPIRAEALVKGKKKESVIQCALEACRILDRQGLLRQATHEGRKRKTRNWEEEDFYDSDEDNYLDRTGTVERKREQRMRNAGKLEDKVETYTSLIEKHAVVVKEIAKLNATLTNHQKAKDGMDDNTGEDALDAFMSNLSSAILNKSEVSKLKLQLQNLRKEEESLNKLINITRPANLPVLNLPSSTVEKDKSTSTEAVIESESPDKRRKVDDDERLVKNHGRYGLITNKESDNTEEDMKNDDIPVDSAEVAETSESKDQQVDEKIDDPKVSESEALKKKKRNMKKMQQKAEKAKNEKQKGYDENVYKEDYSMWLPPQGQSGDGKTSLNDRFGY